MTRITPRSNPDLRPTRPVSTDAVEARRLSFGRCLHASSAAGLICVALVNGAIAQEIPRPSAARQSQKDEATDIRRAVGGLFRIGKLDLQADAALRMEWTDNVNLQASNAAGSSASDFIITPSIGVSATIPVTSLNTLRFRASIGYAKYLNHSNLDRENVVIAPGAAGREGSGLSFDMVVDNLKINFHDRFSLDYDLSTEGAVSGIAQLPRFTNTIGVLALWDTNEVIYTLGYDHLNFITIGNAKTTTGTVAGDVSRLDHSTEQFSASATVKVTTVIVGGIEGSASYSAYPNQPSADFDSYSAGPFIEFQLTKYTHVYMSGGVRIYSSAAGQPAAVSLGSAAPAAASTKADPGYYANVSIVHRLNSYYRDELKLGHSDEAQALSGHSTSDFVRYTSTWALGPQLALSTSLFFEDVHEISGGAFSGPVPVDFKRYGISLLGTYRPGQHTDLSLGYTFTKKVADLAVQDYTQNSVVITLGYRF